MQAKTARPAKPAGARRKLTRAERKQIEAVVRQAKGDGKAHTVQESIPFRNMFPDGLCRLEGGAFSKTIAREHARHGITVNVVCPGPTDTALFADYKEGAGNPEKLEEAFKRSIPLGRIGQPGDLPGAILFFASDDAAYVTGQVLSVSGGLSMVG